MSSVNSLIMLDLKSKEGIKIDEVPSSIMEKLKKESDKLMDPEDSIFGISRVRDSTIKLDNPLNLIVFGKEYNFTDLVNLNLIGYESKIKDFYISLDYKELSEYNNLKLNKVEGDPETDKDEEDTDPNTIKGLVGISFLDGNIVYNLGGDEWIYLNEEGSLVNVSGFVKELNIDSIIMPVDVSNVQVGDILATNGELTIVMEKCGDKIKLLGRDGKIKTIAPNINGLHGLKTVNKVFNPLINNLTGTNSANQINPMMLMLMLDDEEDTDGKMNLMETMLAMKTIQGENFHMDPEIKNE